MEIIKDSDRFDSFQMRVLQEIARDVMNGLIELGIPPDKLQDATENLTFGIAAIVDGSRVMELDGQPVLPVLTFAADEESTQLIHEGGSWMHEYAIGTVEEIVEQHLSESDESA